MGFYWSPLIPLLAELMRQMINAKETWGGGSSGKTCAKQSKEETFVLRFGDIFFKRMNPGCFCFEQKPFETILYLHTRLCFLFCRPKLLLTFQEWASTKDGRSLHAKEEKRKIERNGSMVMSDRAANCVLGDKDGGEKREVKTPSWLSACFWDAGWLGVRSL